MKSANSTIPPGAGQSWDSALRLLNAAEHSQFPPVVAGFDGFVDTILHVVSERSSPAEYTRLLTLQEFAEKVLAASGGRNMNIEMVTHLTKIGGNGPNSLLCSGSLRYSSQLHWVTWTAQTSSGF